MAAKKKKKQHDDFTSLQKSTQEPTPHPEEKGWWLNPPQDLEGAMFMLESRAPFLQNDSPEGSALRALLRYVENAFNETHKEIEREHPLAFYKPSFEQSLLLNAWIWGFDSVVCFSANRIGKTCAFVVNGCLWIFPNNPAWECFAANLTPTGDEENPFTENPLASERYYLDHQQRKVQLILRPNIQILKKIKQHYKDYPSLQGNPYLSHLDPANAKAFAMLQIAVPEVSIGSWPNPPISDNLQPNTIWLGAPDNAFHQEIVLKEWKRWLPRQSIKKWSDTELYFTLTTKDSTNPTTTDWEIYCKSYESEDTKWSGSAVYGIILTEGPNLTIFNEVRQRLKTNAFFSWDYTPYEARNAGAKTKLAYDVFKGKEQLPLNAHIFTKFSARLAPSYILSDSKRADLIRMWEGKPEGDARLEGTFYSSSPLVLSRLDREFHILDWSFATLQEIYPTGQLYRGFDPGYDHPSCCCWALLAPGDIWFIYRYYSMRGRTIAERTDDIITMSNNVRQEFRYPGDPNPHYREMHIRHNSEAYVLTAADFHLFKADEVSGVPYVNNYIREGLTLTESTHMRPKDRANEFDRKLTPNKLITHPLTKKTPGAKVFFLINEPGVSDALTKMEALFWERLASGPNKGEAKDEVPSHGDDELDATCYLVCGQYSHTNYSPPRNNFIAEIEEDFATMQSR